MRRLTALISLLVAFVVAAPAAAKGPVNMDICGLSGCKTFRWAENGGDTSGIVIGLINADALDFAASPRPGPFYELEAKADWLEQTNVATSFFYVPGANVLRAGSNWLQPDRKLSVALRKATTDIEPFPSPTLTRVVVNGRRAQNPAVYEALLGTLPPGEVAASLGDPIEIILRTERPSPWASVRRPLEYYARHNLLHRYVEWLRVPAALANRIERDAGLVAPPADSRSTWPSYVAAAALMLALVAVLALNQRARARVRARVRREQRAAQP